jgi:hypothetical protein
MGVLDSAGRAKAGLDAVRTAYEPLLPVLDGRPKGSVGTTVVNDTTESISGTLSWEAGEEAGEGDVEVGAFERADGPTVPVPKGADEVVLELAAGAHRVTNRYER